MSVTPKVSPSSSPRLSPKTEIPKQPNSEPKEQNGSSTEDHASSTVSIFINILPNVVKNSNIIYIGIVWKKLVRFRILLTHIVEYFITKS